MARGCRGRPRVQSTVSEAQSPTISTGGRTTVNTADFPALGNPNLEGGVNEINGTNQQSLQVTNENPTSKSSYAAMWHKMCKNYIVAEVEYWNQAILCNVLGANPPLSVFEGYSQYTINKVVTARKGLYLVRFGVMADKEEVLKKRIYYFDRKPFIIKAWNENLDLDTNAIKSLPIWVLLPDLDIKYWGADGLSKIGSVIGIPLKTDKQTMNKTYLSYVRIMIDTPLDGPFLDHVDYINDKGRVIRQQVKYDWQPVKYTHCTMYGHTEEQCRKKRVVRQEWKVQNQQDTNEAHETRRRTARRSPHQGRGTEEPASNSFQALLKTEIMEMIGKITDQLVHCEVMQVRTQKHFYITFIYGSNKAEQRRQL
ncbi:hypothetical protein Cgig2_008011 [Carnegiea gigantea]|uniref:DUF4283 domain-containing protein n=1 Tax=Carnegiea gigantea TaxID=171969 RepID=A0A9Q1L0A0_9CARY|nr:hypothetical protein Cgig2_008011 [Carnegiea gigantea]